MEMRPLKKEELDETIEVFLRAYPTGWTAERAREYLEKFHTFDPKRCLVAIDGGVVQGAILGFSYPREDREVLFIQELFVDPVQRHKGIGKKLVGALRDSFSTSPLVKVKPLVRAHTKMLNFYNSLGFDSEIAFTFFDE